MTARVGWVLGCIFAMTAVAAGAFGAHALRDRLPGSLLAIYETAARYQMYHALALLLVAQLMPRHASRAAGAAGWLFLVSSTFTLAKTIRDEHEATLAEHGASSLPLSGT